MKTQSIFIFAILSSLFFFYFFYFSSNSYLKIEQLTATIDELEKTVLKLETKISRLQEILNNPSFENKENYLRQKGIINSNEMLVDIQVPELSEDGKQFKYKVNYFLFGLSIIGFILLFLNYQFRKKKNQSKAIIIKPDETKKNKETYPIE